VDDKNLPSALFQQGRRGPGLSTASVCFCFHQVPQDARCQAGIDICLCFCSVIMYGETVGNTVVDNPYILSVMPMLPSSLICGQLLTRGAG